jgi:hypothetical protein
VVAVLALNVGSADQFSRPELIGDSAWGTGFSSMFWCDPLVWLALLLATAAKGDGATIDSVRRFGSEEQWCKFAAGGMSAEFISNDEFVVSLHADRERHQDLWKVDIASGAIARLIDR